MPGAGRTYQGKVTRASENEVSVFRFQARSENATVIEFFAAFNIGDYYAAVDEKVESMNRDIQSPSQIK
jgi:hypothetical protein